MMVLMLIFVVITVIIVVMVVAALTLFVIVMVVMMVLMLIFVVIIVIVVVMVVATAALLVVIVAMMVMAPLYLLKELLSHIICRLLNDLKKLLARELVDRSCNDSCLRVLLADHLHTLSDLCLRQRHRYGFNTMVPALSIWLLKNSPKFFIYILHFLSINDCHGTI